MEHLPPRFECLPAAGVKAIQVFHVLHDIKREEVVVPVLKTEGLHETVVIRDPSAVQAKCLPVTEDGRVQGEAVLLDGFEDVCLEWVQDRRGGLDEVHLGGPFAQEEACDRQAIRAAGFADSLAGDIPGSGNRFQKAPHQIRMVGHNRFEPVRRPSAHPRLQPQRNAYPPPGAIPNDTANFSFVQHADQTRSSPIKPQGSS